MTDEQHVKALTKKIVECVSTIDTLKAEIRSLRMELAMRNARDAKFQQDADQLKRMLIG